MLRTIAVLFLSVGMLFGCGGGGGSGDDGGGGETLSISNLQYSPSSVLGGSGYVEIVGSIDFKNSDGDVLSLVFTDSNGVDETTSIPGSAGITDGYFPGITGQLDTSTLGTYTFNVWLVDAAGNSSNHLSGSIVITDGPPVAIAGPENDVSTTGSVYFLDGEDSSDPSGTPLTYNWSFVEKPASSTASISNVDASIASFVPDVNGVYKVHLIVNDGVNNSTPDFSTITCIPFGYFTLGSHKEDVEEVEGVPVSLFVGSSYENWGYDQSGLTYIYISTIDNKVISWRNYDGSLHPIIVPGNNVTDATYISIGTHKDDVARIQGTPVRIFIGSSSEKWEYDQSGLTYIYISTGDSRVTSWRNYDGSLILE